MFVLHIHPYILPKPAFYILRVFSDILPKHTFQSLLLKSFTARDAENWEPAWVARYSALIKCRGIIKSKGFIMKAERDIKKRKWGGEGI